MKTAHAPIPALDGIRGLAVLLVLELHFNPRNGWALPSDLPHDSALEKLAARVHGLSSAGWIGVDLFFVLSGFLITRGLLEASSAPLSQRLGRFWARRSLRIFPLYYLTLAFGTIVCLGAARHLVPPLEYWAYLQNYAQAFEKVELSWTGHFWSLAVEEQFYLVWPLVVLFAPRRALPAISLALVFFGAAARLALLRASPWDADTTRALLYRATFTRLDGLVLGAFAAQAAAMPGHPLARGFHRARVPLFVLALVVLAGLFAKTSLNPFDPRVIAVGYLALAIAFVSLVSLTAEDEARALKRLFERPMLRAVGKVSYGMYLLHWPLVVWLWPRIHAWERGLGAAAGLAFALGLTVAASVATYFLAALVFRFVERPFLERKKRFTD